jgi:hypothetical protein
MTIYRPARNLPVGENLPQKFQPGGGNSGVNLGRKFRPRGGNSGPRKFQFGIFGQKFRPFTESCTTARDKGLSEKSRGLEILEFPAPRNSALTEFLAPYQRVAPQPFEKDLAEFSRARNSTRPEFLAPLRSVAPQRFVKYLAEFRRAGPQKFCPGAEIPALGRNFWP